MTLDDVGQTLEATVVHRGAQAGGADIRHVAASDLMSDLLVADRHGHLLVTSLASDQAVRTADIVGAAGLVVVNGKNLPATMVSLAKELDLTLLRTSLRMFEACVKLGKALGA